MPKQPMHDVAIGPDGELLPLSAGEVRRTIAEMIEDGDVLLAVFRAPNGNIAVQVFGPPNEALADVLEEAARNYRTAVRHSLGRDQH